MIHIYVIIYIFVDLRLMKTLLTLKYGTKYSSQDVNRIYANNFAGQKVCVTDDSTGLAHDIQIIPLPNNIEGHWLKLWLHSLENLGEILYLDLDVRIQQSIDSLFTYIDNNPTICYTYWKPSDWPTRQGKDHTFNYLSNYNSSVMLWKSGTTTHIWNHFLTNDDYFMLKYFGDDRFLWHEQFTFNIFPKHLIYSFVYGADYLSDSAKFSYRPAYTLALLNSSDSFPHIFELYDAFSQC